MGILRTDRVSGLGGANAIKGSVFFGNNIDSTGGATGFDYLITERSSNFTFGTGDITIEGWFFFPRLSSSTDYQALVGDTFYYDYGGGSNNGFTFYVEDVQINFWNDVSNSVVSGGTIVQNEWTHLAYTRESGSNKIFVNGSLVGTASDSTNYTDTALSIGANKVRQTSGTDAGQFPFHGFASNVRVLKGRALYTAAFTPPVGELQVIDNTVLLCCQSPGNVLQEATGVILTAPRINTGDKGHVSSGAKASRFTPNSPVGFSTTTDVGTQFGTTFNGVTTFDSQAYMVPPGGNTRERNRGRAVFTGGYNAPQTGTTEMEFFNIQSGGLTEEFGNQSVNRRFAAGLASPTRGVTGGSNGTPSWVTGTMEFVTIADTSNTTTFGNMTAAGGMVSACSSSTRGIFFSVWDASGSGPAHKGHIDFITIATTGNSADFGQLSVSRPEAAGFGSPTRGICAGGYPASDGTTMSNVIDFITIASTGNASDFGDLTQARQAVSGASSQTRGVVAGGYVYGSPAGTFNINTIDFITIASTGNATDFGDLIVGAMAKSVGNCSDLTRGVFAGGKTSAPTYINTIEFVTIASTGNASDFGDLKRTRAYGSAFSDSHGGLS